MNFKKIQYFKGLQIYIMSNSKITICIMLRNGIKSKNPNFSNKDKTRFVKLFLIILPIRKYYLNLHLILKLM